MLLAVGLAAPASAAGPGKVQTTSQANSESLSGVAQAPLRDLNMVRTQIPQVLVAAMADPYARPASLKCGVLAQEIASLDDALGPDIDRPSEEEGLVQRGRETTMSVMAGAATGVIPFRGFVRKLTGAEAHDQTVQQAITAGSVRRAYLKGVGESRRCGPSAAPFRSASASKTPEPPPPPGGGRGLRPRYPIH